MLVKNRNLNLIPADIFSDSYEKTGKYDPKKHALLYIMLNKNGSFGHQKDGAKLGAYGCLVNTHQNYGTSRMEGLGEYATKNIDVEWVVVDKSKIKGYEKITNDQYDRLVNKMFTEFDPRVKINRKKNSDSLVYQVDQDTQHPLTTKEILNLYRKVFGDCVKKTVYPPHTRQQEIVKEREEFRNNNKSSLLLINQENCHTRFGKDKTNYLGQDHQVIVDVSGYFATWQIKDELGPNDHWVKTRNRSKEEILQDILSGLQNGKKIWIPLSAYNKSDHEKIKMLNIFKNSNIALIIDEPDYQQWRQMDFFKEVLKNVIG